MSVVAGVGVVDSADTENPCANENQGLYSTAMKAERNAFALPARIWIVFPMF